MYKAKFYKKFSDKTVACELCHQSCLIKNNSVGTCHVRKNINGELFSLVCGYPVALNVDPIEKKPLFHFQPGSSSYSLGTFGCNFKCANCQNWDISQVIPPTPASPAGGPFIKGENLVEPRPPRKRSVAGAAEKIVSDALTNECSSISYTYNEPTIFTEYALEIMELARKQNLKNVWVSNGYMSDQCLEKISPYLDAINIDLKSIDENFYLKNCGAKLQPVLENLITFKKSGVHLEITTLIIPGLSDDYEMLKRLAEFIVSELGTDVPWHISKFSPSVSWKLKRLSATSEEAILEAYDIGKNAGLKYVYAGNLPGSERENTYCPACGELAIRRFGYEIERLDHHGRCTSCDKNLDIFE